MRWNQTIHNQEINDLLERMRSKANRGGLRLPHGVEMYILQRKPRHTSEHVLVTFRIPTMGRNQARTRDALRRHVNAYKDVYLHKSWIPYVRG